MHLPGYPEQAGPCASGRGWCEYTPRTITGPCCLHCDPRDMLQPSSTRGIYLVAGVKSCPTGVVQDLPWRESSSTLLHAQLYAALVSRLSCPKLKVDFLSLQHPGTSCPYSIQIQPMCGVEVNRQGSCNNHLPRDNTGVFHHY